MADFGTSKRETAFEIAARLDEADTSGSGPQNYLDVMRGYHRNVVDFTAARHHALQALASASPAQRHDCQLNLDAAEISLARVVGVRNAHIAEAKALIEECDQKIEGFRRMAASEAALDILAARTRYIRQECEKALGAVAGKAD